MDFNHVYRPEPSNRNSPSLDALAVARATLIAPNDSRAKLTFAWDDQLVISVNYGEPIDMGVQPYVRGKSVEAPLKKGENTIALWLSNEMGLSRGAWIFSFNAITLEGDVLLPQLDSR